MRKKFLPAPPGMSRLARKARCEQFVIVSSSPRLGWWMVRISGPAAVDFVTSLGSRTGVVDDETYADDPVGTDPTKRRLKMTMPVAQTVAKRLKEQYGGICAITIDAWSEQSGEIAVRISDNGEPAVSFPEDNARIVKR